MDLLDLRAVQGTLKSLLQHHSSKASILWHSAFFMVQLSHPDMTTGKAIALTIWTFGGEAMSLLFNVLSRLHFHKEELCHSHEDMQLLPWPAPWLSLQAHLWPSLTYIDFVFFQFLPRVRFFIRAFTNVSPFAKKLPFSLIPWVSLTSSGIKHLNNGKAIVTEVTETPTQLVYL